jgi:hypothetical protein
VSVPVQERSPSRLPHALVGAGLLLLGLVVALLLLRGHHGGHAVTTVVQPPTQAQPTTTSPPPPPPPSAVADVQVAAPRPFGGTVTWRGPVPEGGRVAYGLAGAAPTLWAPVQGRGPVHRVAVAASFTTAYDVYLSTGSTVAVQPGTPGSAVAASVGGGALLLEGQPFFPLLVVGACPGLYDGLLAVGINVFVGDPCGGLQPQVDGLAGRALSVADASEAATAGAGLIGSYYPDEADGHSMTGANLPQAPAAPPQQVRFLTLTNHFYSGAAPLPQGRGMYPSLIAKADMIGFDLYPLQNWCRPGALGDVYSAQRELLAQAAGKPTFQWIEAGQMDCLDVPALAVTPETVRAESWLAVAGGARGLGFFPIGWTGDIGEAILGVARDVQAIGPALLAPDAPVSITDGPVKVGARSYNGALYVIAVNSGYSAAAATIAVPGLNGRPLTVLDEARQVASDGDSFHDAFAPLAVHLYVAAPG